MAERHISPPPPFRWEFFGPPAAAAGRHFADVLQEERKPERG
jgi:hypothetical protein